MRSVPIAKVENYVMKNLRFGQISPEVAKPSVKKRFFFHKTVVSRKHHVKILGGLPANCNGILTSEDGEFENTYLIICTDTHNLVLSKSTVITKLV